MHLKDDVIAAIATPIGSGGIAVIRVSGKNAIEIADISFRGKVSLKNCATHTAHYGYYVDQNDNVIDEVVATVFREPKSYTGENMVEISCHGSIYISKKVLDVLIKNGARFAKPGEFTKRAFLCGRIDLSQAEAVADLIFSTTELSSRASLSQLRGILSEKIRSIRKKLIDICSIIELELDFVEEGIEFADNCELNHSLEIIKGELCKLIDTYKVGKVYREGVKVVIVGIPNVGKSSIFNNLLMENRAIVTEIPGTTRDVIEENLSIDGILFKVSDTAGLRPSSDLVESEGINRTFKKIDESNVILFVFDGSTENLVNNVLVIKELLPNIGHRELLFVINKIDLISSSILKAVELELNDIKNMINRSDVKLIPISAKTGVGFDKLCSALVDLAHDREFLFPENSPIITSTRHLKCLERSLEGLSLAIESLSGGKSGEFIALDLRNSLNALGEIIGEVTTEDILSNIFSKFCIGK